MTEPIYKTKKEICFHFQRSQGWIDALRKLGLPEYGGRFKIADVERFTQKYPHPMQTVKELNLEFFSASKISLSAIECY